ncbi:MAG: hypothetical protein FGM27_04805 [Candidatus Omnitrophica bacterium]|nr:hypothetical protein [Candidatus Omnitrophota bacterium]
MIWLSSKPRTIKSGFPRKLLLPAAVWILAAAGVSELYAETSQQVLALEPYSVDQGQSLLIPAQALQRFVITDPKVLEVLERTDQGLFVKGVMVGSTSVLIWDAGGLRTLRVSIKVPQAQIKLHEEIKQQSSELYRSRKRRNFKFYHQSSASVLKTGEVYARVDEATKVQDHDFRFEGETPYGNLEGQTLTEYRKDRILGKSVTMLRDLKGGLYDSKIGPVQGYDLIGGEDFVWMNQFGLPGVRIEGVQMRRTESRLLDPQSRQVDLDFMTGLERDGGLIDSPAGIRNRKLKDRMAAERMALHLGKHTWAGSLFQRWSGPKEQQADHNYVGEYYWRGKPFFARSELGGDGEMHSAMDAETGYQNSWVEVRQGWKNVEKDYRTITGSAPGRGFWGYYGSGGIAPLVPLWDYRQFRVVWNYYLYKDRLSLGPDGTSKFIKTFYPGFQWELPAQIFWNVYLSQENYEAASFPYRHRAAVSQFSRDFNFSGPWIKSVVLFIRTAADAYRKAVDSPGFNSDRFEFTPGFHLNLPFGFFGGAEYHLNRLKEFEPVDSEAVTYPAQMLIELGWRKRLGALPLFLNAGTRYVDEKNTFGKVHQPFAGQDRLEFVLGLQYEVKPIGVFFVENRSLMARSIELPDNRNADVTLDAGVRVHWDSPFYLPSRGKVSGFVFIDKNGNGMKDEHEAGVAGYRIKVEKGPEAHSDGSGYYELDIWESVAKIKADGKLPEGYFFTTANQREIEILPKSEERMDFGMATQSGIKGRIFLDLDGNNTYSTADKAIAGIQVQLQSGQSAFSGVDGWYSILRIPPGPNRIMLSYMSLPDGYRSDVGIRRDFEAEAGGTFVYDFPLIAQRIIRGAVYEDINRDGVRGQDEKGVAQVAVTSGKERALTNDKGEYILRNLPHGPVKVRLEAETIPARLKSPHDFKGYQLSEEPITMNQENFPLIGTAPQTQPKERKKFFWEV